MAGECKEKAMSNTYKIAVLPGDGTGPEVIREGLKVVGPLRTGSGSSWTRTHMTSAARAT